MTNLSSSKVRLLLFVIDSPKIVTDNKGFALYFSRSVIPFIRGYEEKDWLNRFPFLKHLGIYAYKADVLKEITQLPQSSLEIAESLEQLRWLQNGYRIRVGITNVETVGIDTPQDLERAERFLLLHGPQDLERAERFLLLHG